MEDVGLIKQVAFSHRREPVALEVFWMELLVIQPIIQQQEEREAKWLEVQVEALMGVEEEAGVLLEVMVKMEVFHYPRDCLVCFPVVEVVVLGQLSAEQETMEAAVEMATQHLN